MAARQTNTKHANRLIHEASPYLLQHAHNPVDWHPWGGDAFRRAAESDKPLFLSIGYSTCHWCHVMERESFEDVTTAAILNDHFVSIKVDREERPDVDETYMKAVQMMTGSGGWPLSIFLTPQGRPFYGGTYFPPRSMYGRPSFQQVLLAIAQAWRDRRPELLGSAEKAADALQSLNVAGSPTSLSGQALEKAFGQLSGAFDASHGGFGDAPKFPQPSTLTFLLGYAHRTGDAKALEMVTKTLDAMAAGGIHDHLGGGFHRYSTDGRWLVPHFEKMLYDQALLGKVYIEAYQATGCESYAAVARDIFDYVLRDLSDTGRGFHAGQDADSEGREGTFYVWTQAEVDALLSQDEAALFRDRYGITKKGNFENGTNILHVTNSPAETSQEIESELAGIRRKLLQHRNARSRPHRDDKVIAGWNGLMISAMAYGGAVLAEPRYVTAAEEAARFVLDSLRVEGRLMRYYRDGRAIERGFLDDYAFMIGGLIDLHQATLDVRWLHEATDLADRMIALFADGPSGGFFLSGEDVERLIVREKPAYDGAVPSGNSAAAVALLRLARITGKERYTSHAQGVLGTFSGALTESPTAFTTMLTALGLSLGSGQEIVIAQSEHSAEAKALIEETRRHFLPDAVLMVRPFGPEAKGVEAVVPFLGRLGPVEGHAAAYVCRDHTCESPVTDPEDLRQILLSISGNQ